MAGAFFAAGFLADVFLVTALRTLLRFAGVDAFAVLLLGGRPTGRFFAGAFFLAGAFFFAAALRFVADARTFEVRGFAVMPFAASISDVAGADVSATFFAFAILLFLTLFARLCFDTLLKSHENRKVIQGSISVAAISCFKILMSCSASSRKSR